MLRLHRPAAVPGAPCTERRGGTSRGGRRGRRPSLEVSRSHGDVGQRDAVSGTVGGLRLDLGVLEVFLNDSTWWETGDVFGTEW